MAGRGYPAGLGGISGPGGGGQGTWARAPGRCTEQGEKKEEERKKKDTLQCPS